MDGYSSNLHSFISGAGCLACPKLPRFYRSTIAGSSKNNSKNKNKTYKLKTSEDRKTKIE
jgi:hypothetical protein